MNIKEAARAIKKGGIVAYPTESFWALGADATNASAVKRVFRMKGRTGQKPIALIAGNLRQVEKFFVMSEREKQLVKEYWPGFGSVAQAQSGAMTLLLKPKSKIAASTLASPPSSPDLSSLGRRGGLRVGVRVPVHAQARALALSVGAPITATSANVSGQAPTKSAGRVAKYFPGILVLAGRCGSKRKPSTVVAVQGDSVHVIRPGSVNI